MKKNIKFLTVIGIGALVTFVLIFFFIAQTTSIKLSEWGNPITISTYLKHQPDSIILTVCNEKTTFKDPAPINDDSTKSEFQYFRNIGDHSEDTPCPTRLTLFYNDSTFTYKMPPFKCNQCDVYHEYIINDDSAYYKVVP